MADFTNQFTAVNSVSSEVATSIFRKVRDPNEWSMALRDILVRANINPIEFQMTGMSTLQIMCLKTMDLVRQSYSLNGLKNVLNALLLFDADEWK